MTYIYSGSNILVVEGIELITMTLSNVDHRNYRSCTKNISLHSSKCGVFTSCLSEHASESLYEYTTFLNEELFCWGC
jgi:hypothetical protein